MKPEESADSWGEGEIEAPKKMNKNSSWGSNISGASDKDDWGDEDLGVDLDADPISKAAEVDRGPIVSGDTAKGVRKEIDEINILSNLCEAHTKVTQGDGNILVALAFAVSEINLTPLQREIYAIAETDRIVIKIKFDAYYMDSMNRPKVTEVGKVSAGGKITVDTPLTDFLFTWTLKERVQNVFIKGRPWPFLDELAKFPDGINTLCDQLCISHLDEVCEAIKEFKGSQGKIMEYFWNEKRKSLPTQDFWKCKADLLTYLDAWDSQTEFGGTVR
eukprot:UN34907